MLCGIKVENNEKVFASACQKKDGPFHCPGCKHELVLKKGRIKVHHFAHKPPYHCHLGRGETEAHRKCKQSIYKALTSLDHVKNVDVEADLGTVIADVYCVMNSAPIAIEIQYSNLSVNDITTRTSAYEKLGIHVLWLGIFNDKLEKDRYSPVAWEKWCHAVYFGRVYYWLADLTVIPTHFADYKSYVEPTSWYDEYGEEQYAGDYYKISKRYKSPLFGKYLNLANDFQPSYKKAWAGGSIDIPNCLIYRDRLKKWW